MTAVERRMLHSDAFAWNMEQDPVLRSTVVAIIATETAPDWTVLRSRVDRLSRLVPQLRMRVRSPSLWAGPPRWVLDEPFDLDFHLRRVPASGGWDDVLEFARREAMGAFDRARPLWVFTLLEGLADGRAAVVIKVHHSLTDGIGGVQLAGLVVDSGPVPADLGPGPAAPVPAPRSAARLAAEAIGDGLGDTAAVTASVLRSLPSGAIRALRDPVRSTWAAVTNVSSIAKIVAPVNRAASEVFGCRDIGRVLATMDVAYAPLRAAAAAGGGHLNDAYLAALVGGVQRYHEGRGKPLQTLRATVPVSVRSAADAVGGNRITLIRVVLPASIADPRERISQIARIMRRWRCEPALARTQQIAFGLNLLPRPYLGNIFKRVEMLASDVPGIPQPVWLAGARITGYYPFGPTIGSALNATLMSYAGTCNIGINVDTSAVDDTADLLRCLQAGFDDVLGNT